MRWPWRRTDPVDDALADDEKRLAQVRGQWGQVREAAGRMEHHRRRNHFAQSIEAIYRSRP